MSFDEARRDLAGLAGRLPRRPVQRRRAAARPARVGRCRPSGCEALRAEPRRLRSARSSTRSVRRRARYEHRAHLPELARYDTIGRRIEAVRFDPDYHRAGAAVWGSGLVAELGHAGPRRTSRPRCCTCCRSRARPATRARPCARSAWRGRCGARPMPACGIASCRRCSTPTTRHAQRGSQFLTEVQGGSDVGANATVARPHGDGTYEISRGEVVLLGGRRAAVPRDRPRARRVPPGTRGLGCFVMPAARSTARPTVSRCAGSRRSSAPAGMASGEIDLDGGPRVADRRRRARLSHRGRRRAQHEPMDDRGRLAPA